MKKITDDLKSNWKCAAPLYIDKSDERYEKYQQQLNARGFSDTETWNMDSVFSEFVLPRLIRFKEINNGFPFGTTAESWNEIIDKMIFAFNWSLNCEIKENAFLTNKENDANWEKYNEGIALFAKHYRDLWW